MMLSLLAILDGKQSGRPGFNFACHRATQRETDTGWTRTYYKCPGFNVLQFGAELFPEWYAEVCCLQARHLAQLRGQLHRTQLRTLLKCSDSSGYVFQPSWPTWFRKIFLKPYTVMEDLTLSQSLELIWRTLATYRAKAAETHKFDHYNSLPLIHRALPPGGAIISCGEATLRALRPRSKKIRR